jgi:hypothetical protein
MDLVEDADALVEADEIRATAEENVLTIVDDFTDAGVQIGTCAPTEITAPLHKTNVKARLGQGACRAHAGHAASDDRNGFVQALAQCPALSI